MNAFIGPMMKLTIELLEADRNLNTMPTNPAKKVFSDLREMICNRTKALTEDTLDIVESN